MPPGQRLARSWSSTLTLPQRDGQIRKVDPQTRPCFQHRIRIASQDCRARNSARQRAGQGQRKSHQHSAHQSLLLKVITAWARRGGIAAEGRKHSPHLSDRQGIHD